MSKDELKDTIQWFKNLWIIQLFIILAIAFIKIVICGVSEVLGVVGAVLFFSTIAMFIFISLVVCAINGSQQ